MKQLVQNIRTGRSEVQDVPAPVARQGEVLIRVRASLVSAGTERMVVDFARKNLVAKARSRPDLVRQTLAKFRREGFNATLSAVRSRLDQPMALGYSVAGDVIAVGAGVSGIKAGDRVAAAGADHAVHAEVVSVPRNLVVTCAASVPYESACFTTLGAIALHAVRLADCRLGETVAVLGLGLLGQLAVQLLRAAGCSVAAYDPAPDRVALAARAGAAAHADASAFESDVLARTGGHGADAVIIAAATASAAPVAVAGRIARDKGVVVAAGAVALDLPRKTYFEKEIDFRVSRSYGPGRYDASYEEKGIDYPYGYVRWTENRNMVAFAELLASGAVDPAPLVTHRIDIADGARAYALLSGERSEPFLGIVLSYPQRDEAERTIVPVDVRPRAASEHVRLGVIGAGSFARSVLLPAFRDAGAAFEAVATGSGASARNVADAFRFRYCTTDVAAVLADANVDAAVIATRHNLHGAQTIDALRAGKHVFVEKPLCISSAELDEIERVYASLSRRPVLMVGFNRRFAPLSLRMKETFDGCGEPLVISYRVNGGFIARDSWIQDPDEGGGRLIGECVHFIDWACWLAGDAPARVTAGAAANAGKYSDDNLQVTIEFAGGSLFSLLYVASGDTALGKERIEVHGGGRSAVLDDFRRFEAWTPRGHRKQRLLNADKGHKAEAAAFVAAVRGGALPMPFEEIVITMRAAFAAAENLRA